MAPLLVVPALAVLAGCGGGGGSPAAPPVPVAATPTPAPTPVPPPVALEGLTHEPVAAEITPPSPGLRDAVSARAPGFLLREQRYDGGPIYLWQVEEDYVNAVVYWIRFTDDSYRMVRWAGGFTVTLDEGLTGNDTVVRKTHDTVAEIARHTGLPLAVGPGGAVQVTVDGTILDSHNAVGLASFSFQGATIVGGTVKFASVQDLLGTNRADYTNVFLHEMGHVMGLGHSPLAREIMTPGGGSRTTLGEFQRREALTLHMMYHHRQAGNWPPDRDAALGAQAAARPAVSVVVD